MFGAQAVVVLCNLGVYRLAKVYLGETGFAEYSLSRRTIGFLLPLLVLGLDLAVARAVAVGDARGRREERFGAFLGGLALGGAAWSVFILALVLFPEPLAYVLFAGPAYRDLLYPIALILLALVFHVVCYAYFRGRMCWVWMAVLESSTMGLFALGAFVWAGVSTAQVLWWTGGLAGALGLVAAVWILVTDGCRVRGWRAHFQGLLVFGLPRAVTPFALAALLGLPATLTAHFQGMKEAGVVAFGSAMITLAGAAVAPLGLILLPKSVRMLQAGEHAELRAHLHRLLKWSALFVLAGVLAGMWLMDVALRVYLGPEFVAHAGILRLMIWGALPHVFFNTLRYVVDIAHPSARNTINTLIALAVFLVLGLAGGMCVGGTEPILVAFLASLSVLGWLTWRDSEAAFARQERPFAPEPA
jgi:O-antigen/teichoic acid export membrane protein